MLLLRLALASVAPAATAPTSGWVTLTGRFSGRRYKLTGVDSVEKGVPQPLIVALHGYYSDPEILESDSGLTLVASAVGALVAYPEGVDAGPGAGWAFPGCNSNPAIGSLDSCGRRATCAVGYTPGCTVSGCPSDAANEPCGGATDECATPTLNCNWCGCTDDEAVIRAVVDDVASTLCVDILRVYLTGMSQGGMMTSWLASRSSDLFTAYAPVSGTNPRDFWTPIPNNADVSLLWLNGVNDVTVPYDGAMSSLADGSYYYESVTAESARAAAALGCSATPTESAELLALAHAPPSAGLECYEYAGCAPSAGGNSTRAIGFCLWNGNHVWPNADDGQNPWGSRLVSGFFLQQARATPGNLTAGPCPAGSSGTNCSTGCSTGSGPRFDPQTMSAGESLGLAVAILVTCLLGAALFYQRRKTGEFPCKIRTHDGSYSEIDKARSVWLATDDSEDDA